MDQELTSSSDAVQSPDKSEKIKEEAQGGNPQAKWLNNDGAEVEEVFGFNVNAELVNGRAAMVGFLMLIITELVFQGAPVTHSIFGIN